MAWELGALGFVMLGVKLVGLNDGLGILDVESLGKLELKAMI